MKQHPKFDKSKMRRAIFSDKLCDFLLEKGHKLMGYAQSKHGKGLVFFFKNTNELCYDIDAFKGFKETRIKIS